jgi:hypothetical protein
MFYGEGGTRYCSTVERILITHIGIAYNYTVFDEYRRHCAVKYTEMCDGIHRFRRLLTCAGRPSIQQVRMWLVAK